MNGPPCFLVGAERSGTTMLRLMLDHHPQIAWLNEFEYAVDLVTDSGRTPTIKEYERWLSAHRIFLATGYEFLRDAPYQRVVESFLLQKQREKNKPIIGATVHRHFDRLLHLWPNAKFIHIRRDPRDVASSCVAMGWSGNVWTGVRRWVEVEQLWSGLAERLPNDRKFDIRYEDLLEAPEIWLRLICAFLATPYDDAMLSYPSDTTYSAPDPAYSQQWVRRLAPKKIRLVESRVGELLDERGYEPSDLPKLDMTRPLASRLRAHDKLVRLQFRWRRYGLSLLVRSWIAKALGLSEAKHRLQLRFNAVDAKRLK